MINRFQKHTINLITILMVCFTMSDCSFTNRDNNGTIRGVKVAYNIPILKLDGELLNVTDSFFVFYFKDFVLYKVTYKQTTENDTMITSIEVKYNYFVYQRNTEIGFYYDSLKLAPNKKFLIDSFLKLKAFKGFNYYDKVNDSLIKKISSVNGDVIEVYLPRIKYDQSYGDTTYIHYTKDLKDVEYSFSKELDSSRGMKVDKVRIVYNSQFYKGYPFKFPKCEYLFELTDVNVNDSDQIRNLFQQFEQYLHRPK